MTTERRTPARKSSIALGATAVSGMVALTGLIGIADAAPAAHTAVESAAPEGATGSTAQGTLTVIVVPRTASAGTALATRQPPPAPAAGQAPAPQVDTSAS